MLAGVASGPFFASLLLPAAASVAPLPVHFDSGLFHGVGPELLLSVGSWILAALVFWKRAEVARGASSALARIPGTGDRAYDAAMAGIGSCSTWVTSCLQSGVHRRYVATVFVVLTVAVGSTLVAKDAVEIPRALPDAPFFDWTLGGLIAASSVAIIFTRSRLLAICAIGVVGTATSLVFLLSGAPDVAMAQLMVETLVVVIVAIVLLRLPSFHYEVQTERPRRLRDALIAISTGVTTTLLVLAVSADPPQRSLTEFFEATAVPAAHGRNIVNVILVDFRALDTMGEITVLFLAGAAVCALIMRRSRYRSLDPSPAKDPTSAPGRSRRA